MRLRVTSFFKTLLLIGGVSSITIIMKLGSLPKSQVTAVYNTTNIQFNSSERVVLNSSSIHKEISQPQNIEPKVFNDENMDLARFIEVYTALCKEMTFKKYISEDGLCPCYPKDLARMGVDLQSPSLNSLILDHPELSPGGIWKPKNCTARQHVAIIIPFRDRESHLRVQLKYLHPMLQKQMIHYQIFVVEQIGKVTFNKGMLMNAGFTEATREEAFDCVIFHDVDIIPEDYRNMYTCTKYVRHIATYIDKMKYELPYLDAFGGAVSFTVEQFKQVNGFSSIFYGWGGEDDEMRGRVTREKMEIIRFPKSVSRHKIITHPRDKTNPHPAVYGSRWNAVYKYANKTKIYGLNDRRYTVKGLHRLPLYTWILLDVAPQILDIDVKPK